MLFQSTTFIFVFLPLAILGLWAAVRVDFRAYLALLSLVSIVFYAAHEPIYLVLLAGSALFNYVLAGHIDHQRNHSAYVLGIVANVALLAVFKYTNFVIGNLNLVLARPIGLAEIVLPLAISFITFEQIAFLTDVHNGRYERGKPIEYLAFITFFPKLIAGPIIRYSEFYPQLAAHRGITLDGIVTGLCIFSVALCKKVLLADYFGGLSDKHYADLTAGKAVAVVDAWVAFLAYPLQIYFDFSAYSEMAIGIAWMMGFRLPINFLSPYKATSIIDFWRRWHITLSAVLRDYIYIALGGNRLGIVRRYANLMAVMLIGGLWHGAAWTFVIWGAMHGLMLVANHLWRALEPAPVRLPTSIAWLLTMAGTLVAWVFFRAQDFGTAGRMLATLVGSGPPAEPLNQGGDVWLALVVGWAICVWVPNLPQIFAFVLDRDRVDWSRVDAIPSPSRLVVALSALAFCVSLAFIFAGVPNAFIYFQF